MIHHHLFVVVFSIRIVVNCARSAVKNIEGCVMSLRTHYTLVEVVVEFLGVAADWHVAQGAGGLVDPGEGLVTSNKRRSRETTRPFKIAAANFQFVEG